VSDEIPGLVTEAARFSTEAFELAKTLVDGDEELGELQRQAGELQERLSELSAQVDSVPEEYRPDIRRSLADASLDLRYVLAGGNVPSSVRLHHFAAERTP
jgi:hypothetical protein